MLNQDNKISFLARSAVINFISGTTPYHHDNDRSQVTCLRQYTSSPSVVDTFAIVINTDSKLNSSPSRVDLYACFFNSLSLTIGFYRWGDRQIRSHTWSFWLSHWVVENRGCFIALFSSRGMCSDWQMFTRGSLEVRSWRINKNKSV